MERRGRRCLTAAVEEELSAIFYSLFDQKLHPPLRVFRDKWSCNATETFSSTTSMSGEEEKEKLLADVGLRVEAGTHSEVARLLNYVRQPAPRLAHEDDGGEGHTPIDQVRSIWREGEKELCGRDLCPAAPKAAPTMALTAWSRSASGMTVAWFFAPRLACTLLPFFVARSKICSPAAFPPTKETAEF